MNSAFVSPLPLQLALPSLSKTCSLLRRCRTRHSVSTRRLPSCTASPPSPSPSASPSPATKSTSSAVTFTSLDNNGFVLRYRDFNLVIDPWLYGDLTFLSPSVFKLRKAGGGTEVSSFPIDRIDAIFLTQGLEDHTHPPTLSRLSRDIPIFAPTSARALLTELSFSCVTYVRHGDTAVIRDGIVSVSVLPGSLVGPPWSERELAPLFKFGDEKNGDQKVVYHEPHGDHVWKQLEQLKVKNGIDVDVVIAPFVNAFLQVKQMNVKVYDLVYGTPTLLKACKVIRPAVCVAFDNSKGDDPSGVLVKLLGSDGDAQQLQQVFDTDPDLANVQLIAAPKPMDERVICSGSTSTSTSTSNDNNDSGSESVVPQVGASLGPIFQTS